MLTVAAMMVSATGVIAATTAYRIRTCTGSFSPQGTSARLGQNDVRDACYTDIQALWGGRGFFLHQMPYIHLPDHSTNLAQGGLEYPVVTGLATWLTAHFAHDDRAFLLANAVLLTILLLGAIVLLARMAGSRAWILAVGTPTILWAAYNWDVISMTATVLAIAAWMGFRPMQRSGDGRPVRFDGYPLAAGVLLGIGTATKLYPAIFLLPLALDRWHAHDQRSLRRLIGGFVGAWLVLNLPFMAINLWGWGYAYLDQAHRAPASYDNSIWWYLHLDGYSSLPFVACFAVAGVAILLWSWSRSKSQPSYPWLYLCLLLLTLFLFSNKVFSPQYSLWLLPFIVLVDVPAVLWVSYMVVEAAAFAAFFGRLSEIPDANEICVFLKAVILLGIMAFAANRAGRGIRFEEERYPRHLPTASRGASTQA